MRRVRCWRLVIPLTVAATVCFAEPRPAPELQGIRALGRYGRVDLIWAQPSSPAGNEGAGEEPLFFEIERRGPGETSFRRINKLLWTTNVYGDFIGMMGGTYAYRVRGIRVSEDGKEKTYSAWSPVVEASPRGATPESLMMEVQEASFRYFYNWRHPVSGLAREKTPPRQIETINNLTLRYLRQVRDSKQLCTTGATGMGMFNLVVGVERGFITRGEGIAWALQMLQFLSSKAERFHGAFSHWLEGDTGRTLPFAGPEDNGADTVETAFLASGFIVLREYFTGDDAAEKEIRQLADGLWRDIEWDWFTRGEGQGAPLYWHWSPNYGWDKEVPVRGFNEAAILYVLAVASPTHAIRPDSYRKAWQHTGYGSTREAFGIPMTLGHKLGPPLFFTHYSYLGLDPRRISYRGETYYEHFRKFCQVQVKYAASKANVFKGYGPLWGLTASSGPKGYGVYSPGEKDDGTIAPTAALSSMPYLPKEGYAFLENLYLKYARELWKDYGFTDAFNLTQQWVSPLLLGIDAGPIAPMIENARTALCWKIFMKAPEVQAGLKTIE